MKLHIFAYFHTRRLKFVKELVCFVAHQDSYCAR